METWKVYLLECSDSTYYCGITKRPIEDRVKDHNKGIGSKYTRGRLPVAVIALSREMTQTEAMRLEKKIKKIRRNKKISYFEQLL